MIDKIISHIDAEKDSHLQRLLEFLRIPSISTDPDRKDDMRRGAEWVHNLFGACAIESEILPTAGHPCIIADSGPAANGGPAVLVYGHYDVQPTGDDSLWHSPPFEPTIRKGKVYARGSADDKGQVITHMLAAQAWASVAGGLPVRVKFLIEGEEEIGSPNLADIIRKHKKRLACDYVVLSDTPKLDETTPAITYGTKGLVYKEIVVTGPRQDLHSGSYGGSITNPANALAQIIARMRDSENRVTIPHFYDDIRDISEKEKARMAQLPFEEEAYRQTTGAPSLEGEAGFTTLERRWVRPTLDVNGLLSGFTGKGGSTIIPARAMAKVSMRIVPGQNHERISKLFDEAVRAFAPPGINVEVHTHASCNAYVAPLDSPGMKAAAEAVEAGYGKAPAFIREGGTLPILPLFKEVLGAESLMIGFCVPDCNAHGPNEFFAADDLHCGTRVAAHFVDRLARMG